MDEDLETLMDWVNALIDEKIQDAFGRDSLQETCKRQELEEEVRGVWSKLSRTK